MKNTLEKRLFTNLFINENGIIKKENREGVEIIGSFVVLIGIALLTWLSLIAL